MIHRAARRVRSDRRCWTVARALFERLRTSRSFISATQPASLRPQIPDTVRRYQLEILAISCAAA